MNIGKNELSEYLETLIKDKKPEELNQAICTFLQFIKSNYDQLDDDAKESTHKMMDSFIANFKHNVENILEPTTKREYMREIDKLEGKHIDVNLLIAGLERAPSNSLPMILEFRTVFTLLSQSLLDLLYEIRKSTMSGPIENTCMPLFYLCLNELLVCFHLCQHGYAEQAYSHIRTIDENLDKIELFSSQPQWIGVWVGEDGKKKWDELKPSQVRKKLGKEKHSEMYSLLSEIGTHTSFKSIQARMGVQRSSKSEKPRQARIVMGGAPHSIHTHTACVLCVISALRLLIVIPNAFIKRLDEKEFTAILDRCFLKAKEFTEKDIEWMVSEGFSVEGLNEVIDCVLKVPEADNN